MRIVPIEQKDVVTPHDDKALVSVTISKTASSLVRFNQKAIDTLGIVLSDENRLDRVMPVIAKTDTSDSENADVQDSLEAVKNGSKGQVLPYNFMLCLKATNEETTTIFNLETKMSNKIETAKIRENLSTVSAKLHAAICNAFDIKRELDKNELDENGKDVKEIIYRFVLTSFEGGYCLVALLEKEVVLVPVKKVASTKQDDSAAKTDNVVKN